jgi:hypothetical protein
MPAPPDTRIYEALVIPNEALDRGGMEILRAGLVDDELYVTARRVFTDPATWGEILGEITQRLGRIYAAEGEYKANEVIADGGAADRGAPPQAGDEAQAGSQTQAGPLQDPARHQTFQPQSTVSRCRSISSCRRCRPPWRRAISRNG